MPAVDSSSVLQRSLYRLQAQSLRNLGTKADFELGFTDPHSMQDAGKLARHGDDRAQHAGPLGVFRRAISVAQGQQNVVLHGAIADTATVLSIHRDQRSGPS
jgi:hypothetical protein